MNEQLKCRKKIEVSKSFLILLVSIFLTTSAFASDNLEKQILTITTPDGRAIDVETEIARTDKERSIGYMYRTVIPEGTGMLFMFKQDQQLRFWMKNTPTPLSIAYIDAQGTLQEIYKLTPFSLATVTGTLPARYALEVPQGWFQKNAIAVGSTIEIPDFEKNSQ